MSNPVFVTIIVMNKKAALVLSGGSILGLAHLGVIEELQEAGYKFDAIYGVSAGALVGAGLAHGMTTQEMKSNFLKMNLLKIGLDMSKRSAGIIQGSKFKEHFENLFRETKVQDLATPLTIGSTDFDTGNYVQIKKGLVSDAVRSSTSIPIVFEPFFHPLYKKHLADGSLTRNLPLKDAVTEYAGSEIIAINVQPVQKLPNDFYVQKKWSLKTDMVRYMEHSYNILINAQWRDNSDSRVHMITPDLEKFTTYSLQKKNYEPIIQAGRDAAMKFLQEKTDTT